MPIRRLLVLVALLACFRIASARVDVNSADQAALDGIKGLGPTTSKAILAERHTNGKFRDWADFENRVRGIGKKKSAQLSRAGLTVSGKSKPGALPTRNDNKGPGSSTITGNSHYNGRF